MLWLNRQTSIFLSSKTKTILKFQISGITNGGRRVVKALCAYTARADSDISFRKGDRMEVLSDAEPDWWRVLHLTTRREGLVPVNFVAEESSVECEE